MFGLIPYRRKKGHTMPRSLLAPRSWPRRLLWNSSGRVHMLGECKSDDKNIYYFIIKICTQKKLKSDKKYFYIDGHVNWIDQSRMDALDLFLNCIRQPMKKWDHRFRFFWHLATWEPKFSIENLGSQLRNQVSHLRT